MAAGGTNGTVTNISTTASGSSVTVSYPADPGPPPVPAHTETYDPVADPFLRRFESAQTGKLLVNVTTDANGAVSGVGAHS